MRKNKVRDKIHRLPDATDWIAEEEKKDHAFKASMDRLRLRVAIVKAIRKARERANITQEELAKALGVSQAMIGRLESMKDSRLPELDLLLKISQVTKKSIRVHEDEFDLELVAK